MALYGRAGAVVMVAAAFLFGAFYFTFQTPFHKTISLSSASPLLLRSAQFPFLNRSLSIFHSKFHDVEVLSLHTMNGFAHSSMLAFTFGLL
jgi:hypothetical protein